MAEKSIDLRPSFFAVAVSEIIAGDGMSGD